MPLNAPGRSFCVFHRIPACLDLRPIISPGSGILSLGTAPPRRTQYWLTERGTTDGNTANPKSLMSEVAWSAFLPMQLSISCSGTAAPSPFRFPLPRPPPAAASSSSLTLCCFRGLNILSSILFNANAAAAGAGRPQKVPAPCGRVNPLACTQGRRWPGASVTRRVDETRNQEIPFRPAQRALAVVFGLNSSLALHWIGQEMERPPARRHFTTKPSRPNENVIPVKGEGKSVHAVPPQMPRPPNLPRPPPALGVGRAGGGGGGGGGDHSGARPCSSRPVRGGSALRRQIGNCEEKDPNPIIDQLSSAATAEYHVRIPCCKKQEHSSSTISCQALHTRPRDGCALGRV